MYLDCDLATFSPICCGDKCYVVIGHDSDVDDFSQQMAGADADIVAFGGNWRAGFTQRTGNTCTFSLPDDLARLTDVLDSRELEGVIVCADSLLYSRATSQLHHLKDMEAYIRNLARALVPTTGPYTGAIVVGTVPSFSPKSLDRSRSLVEVLVVALSGGFEDGGAKVKTNGLLVGAGDRVEGNAGDDSGSEVPGAIHHLVSDGFIDRSILKLSRGLLTSI